MAYTLSTIVQSVFGDKRLQLIRVTADSAEANITTALGVVEAVSISLEKGQTMPIAQINKDSTATASNGTVGISGCSNANVFNMICYGH
jgi:hypothetical protein